MDVKLPIIPILRVSFHPPWPDINVSVGFVVFQPTIYCPYLRKSWSDPKIIVWLGRRLQANSCYCRLSSVAEKNQKAIYTPFGFSHLELWSETIYKHFPSVGRPYRFRIKPLRVVGYLKFLRCGEVVFPSASRGVRADFPCRRDPQPKVIRSFAERLAGVRIPCDGGRSRTVGLPLRG